MPLGLVAQGHQDPRYEMPAPGSVVIGQSLKVEHFRLSYCAQEAFKPGQKLIGLLGLRDLLSLIHI